MTNRSDKGLKLLAVQSIQELKEIQDKYQHEKLKKSDISIDSQELSFELNEVPQLELDALQTLKTDRMFATIPTYEALH